MHYYLGIKPGKGNQAGLVQWNLEIRLKIIISQHCKILYKGLATLVQLMHQAGLKNSSSASEAENLG